jgi:hypothetical protein
MNKEIIAVLFSICFKLGFKQKQQHQTYRIITYRIFSKDSLVGQTYRSSARIESLKQNFSYFSLMCRDMHCRQQSVNLVECSGFGFHQTSRTLVDNVMLVSSLKKGGNAILKS